MKKNELLILNFVKNHKDKNVALGKIIDYMIIKTKRVLSRCDVILLVQKLQENKEIPWGDEGVEGGYQKTTLGLEEHITCHKCNEVVEICDECGEYFELGNGIITSNNTYIYCDGYKHICPVCFKKMVN